MKITPDELSRRIAEFLEPRTDGRPKIEKCWVWKFNMATNQSYWVHKNMIEDPEMTVMLLEKLLVHHNVKFETSGDSKMWY